MKKLKFNVRLEGGTSGEGAALSAPFDVEKTFGTRARVPVRGVINGFPFRSSLMPMGGCHRMVVNKDIRKGGGKSGRYGEGGHGTGRGAANRKGSRPAAAGTGEEQDGASELGQTRVYS
jgi:hypothetical protein